jgi:hypothetical protein
MFKTSAAPEKEDKGKEHERLVREREETVQLLKRLADEIRPKIEERQPELLEQAEAAHKEDVESYSFECSRSGDFLSVTITRGYAKSVLGNTLITKSTALNLRATTEFVLTEGHGPDRKGSVSIPCNTWAEKDGAGIGTIYGTSSQHDPYSPRVARKGREWRCEMPYFWVPRERSHYSASGKDDEHTYYKRIDSDRPRFEGHVRAAEDDRIEFRGIGITIYAPGGLGRSVHDKILAALR